MVGGPDTQIDLSTVHQSIVDAIAAQFPALATVEDYREDRKGLPLPAVLVELADMEPDPDADPGTEQLAVQSRWEARIIIGFRKPNAEREVRRLAAALGVFVHQNRFGEPIGSAEVLAIAPDSFDPDLDQYVVWLVEWQQIVHLGGSVWANDSDTPIPSQVLYSWAPNIGPDHEPDYRELDVGASIEGAP